MDDKFSGATQSSSYKSIASRATWIEPVETKNGQWKRFYADLSEVGRELKVTGGMAVKGSAAVLGVVGLLGGGVVFAPLIGSIAVGGLCLAALGRAIEAEGKERGLEFEVREMREQWERRLAQRSLEPNELKDNRQQSDSSFGRIAANAMQCEPVETRSGEWKRELGEWVGVLGGGVVSGAALFLGLAIVAGPIAPLVTGAVATGFGIAGISSMLLGKQIQAAADGRGLLSTPSSAKVLGTDQDVAFHKRLAALDAALSVLGTDQDVAFHKQAEGKGPENAQRQMNDKKSAPIDEKRAIQQRAELLAMKSSISSMLLGKQIQAAADGRGLLSTPSSTKVLGTDQDVAFHKQAEGKGPENAQRQMNDKKSAPIDEKRAIQQRAEPLAMKSSFKPLRLF